MTQFAIQSNGKEEGKVGIVVMSLLDLLKFMVICLDAGFCYEFLMLID
jgi:hypothetical protein